jgi:FkbM family methyltransferase
MLYFSRFLPDSFKDRVRQRAGAITVRQRLANLRSAGFSPATIIDAGAFHGDWSLLCAGIFPEARFLMIEPQPESSDLLTRLCASDPRLKFRQALLGSEPGRATFALQKTNSRVVADDHQPAAGETLIRLPVERLDAIAAAEGFADCDFLKLDLQGHELHALEGAGSLFGRAEVVQIEASLLRLGDGPLIHEVATVFHQRGYRLYDVFGLNYRPLDKALWQADLLFVRQDSALLRSRAWA